MKCVASLAVFIVATAACNAQALDPVADRNFVATCAAQAPPSSEAARRASVAAIEAAIQQRAETEALAESAYGDLKMWPRVVERASQALASARKAAGGHDGRCTAPFLETLAASLAGAHEPGRAEPLYRQAITLLGHSPSDRPHRASMLENLSSLLHWLDRPLEAQEALLEMRHIQLDIRRSDPSYDPYAAMQAYIGPTELEPVFIGAGAGARKLNDDAVRLELANLPFESQMKALHALDLLDARKSHGTVHGAVSSNLLAATLTVAKYADDPQLASDVFAAWEDRIRELEAVQVEPGRIDDELVRLILARYAQGSLDADCRPCKRLTASLPRRRPDSGASILLVQAGLAGLNGEPAKASQLLSAARNVPGSPYDKDIFDLEEAALTLKGGNSGYARRLATKYTEVDHFGKDHQATALRLAAAIDVGLGDWSGAAGFLAKAEKLVDSLEGKPSSLAIGLSHRHANARLSRDAAVTFALAQPDNAVLAEFALRSVFRSRQLDVASLRSDLHVLNLLPLGAGNASRRQLEARALLARELRLLMFAPGSHPRWGVIENLLDEEDEVRLTIARQRASVIDLGDSEVPAGSAFGADTAVAVFVEYLPYDAVRDALGAGINVPAKLALAWVQEGKVLRWEDLGEASGVAALARAFTDITKRADLSDEAARRDFDESAQRFRTGVFGSRAGWLEGLHHLLIMPDGGVSLAPFSAALDVDGQQNGPTLRMVQTAADMDSPLVRAGGPMVVFGNVSFDASETVPPDGRLRLTVPRKALRRYDRLTYVDDEIQALKTHFPQAILYDREKASALQLLSVKRPSILHIASHGEFQVPAGPGELEGGTSRARTRLLRVARNPMLMSTLVMAGVNSPAVGDLAYVTAFELASLDLEDAELIVLSACESGVGDPLPGEGIMGLPRALAIAGAKRVITSLWRVEDQPTALLMSQLYKSLRAGATVEVALRLAQHAVRAVPEWRSPYYWAGLVLSGRGGSAYTDAGRTGAGNASASIQLPTATQPRAIKAHFEVSGGEVQISSAPSAPPALDPARMVVPVESLELVAIDMNAGRAPWRMRTRGKVTARPLIVGGRVYFGDEEGDVYAVSLDDGHVHWHRAVDSAILDSVVAGPSELFVATFDARLIALDRNDGHVLWIYQFGAQSAVKPGTDRSPATQGGTAPLVAGEFVYVGDFSGQFAKLRRLDGTVIWQTGLGSGISALAADLGDAVAVATWGGEVVAVDKATGTVKWRYGAKQDSIDSLLLAQGVIVYSTLGFGPVRALAAENGSLRWSYSAASHLARPLLYRGTAVLLSGADGMTVLDTDTGSETPIFTRTRITHTSPLVGAEIVGIGADQRLYRIRLTCQRVDERPMAGSPSSDTRLAVDIECP